MDTIYSLRNLSHHFYLVRFRGQSKTSVWWNKRSLCLLSVGYYTENLDLWWEFAFLYSCHETAQIKLSWINPGGQRAPFADVLRERASCSWFICTFPREKQNSLTGPFPISFPFRSNIFIWLTSTSEQRATCACSTAHVAHRRGRGTWTSVNNLKRASWPFLRTLSLDFPHIWAVASTSTNTRVGELYFRRAPTRRRLWVARARANQLSTTRGRLHAAPTSTPTPMPPPSHLLRRGSAEGGFRQFAGHKGARLGQEEKKSARRTLCLSRWIDFKMGD